MSDNIERDFDCQRCDAKGFVLVPMLNDWDEFDGEYAERKCPDCSGTGLRPIWPPNGEEQPLIDRMEASRD